MLKQGERIDQLFREDMKIIQSNEVFSFSVDALLLGNFIRLTNKTRKIMDLCSGNGIIPLLLSYRTKVRIDAIEIQEQVVDMAERNIYLNGKSDQIFMYHIDMNDIKASFSHSLYDTVTVNPPYFTNDQPVKTKAPHSAARHEIYIDLEHVVKTARFLVKNKGRLFIVHRAERSAEVIAELHNQGFKLRRLQYVYNDSASDRALFVLIEAIFNSDTYVDVLPPFYIYNEDKTYTEDMLEVYYG